MISLEQYKKILDSGLLLDHYLCLCSIRDGRELPTSKRITGFTNLLNKKGYIEDGLLTEKAVELIDSQSIVVVSNVEIDRNKFDFGGWVLNLHKKLQDRLVELTGRKQVTAKINRTDKKGYPFLCNATDLGRKLQVVIRNYNLKDVDLIEKALLSHIENCNNGNEWFPLIKYYISKDSTSQMVTEMESGVDPTGDPKSAQKFV